MCSQEGRFISILELLYQTLLGPAPLEVVVARVHASVAMCFSFFLLRFNTMLRLYLNEPIYKLG
jgi:hypothetical protein